MTPKWRRLLPPTGVVAAYFVLGLVAFWPVVPEISHHIFSTVGDLTLTVWYLGWVPHALTHGLNPLFSNAMFAPTGVNLAQNTEAPLLGLIAAPITWAFGPLVSTNLLLVLGMPISATAAFVVLRKWEVWGPPAALGGLIYGFSPYMVGQGFAHPVLTFVPLPPFIVMTVVSILQRRRPPRRLGIQLGLLVAAQYLISPEVLVTVVVLTGAALVFVALGSPSKVPQLARTAAGPIGISMVLAVVLLAYPVWMLLAGPQHVSGPTYPLINSYHNDLLSFVDHGLWQQVSLGMQSNWAGPLAMFESPEYGGYVGIPAPDSDRFPRVAVSSQLPHAVVGRAFHHFSSAVTRAVSGHSRSGNPRPTPFLAAGPHPVDRQCPAHSDVLRDGRLSRRDDCVRSG